MFKKILVANRGEIALRIMRACHEMGIQTVAVHSEADTESLHVRFANEAVCIGPNTPGESYLNFNRIISAASDVYKRQIHPGYGFLSERAEFAEAVTSCGIAWIGPSTDAIERMGNKSVAKDMMKAAGVPVIPGSDGPVSDETAAIAVAEEIGYPVIIKAASGGGGRGMRVARDKDDLANALLIARAEAETAFGDPSVYIEKYLPTPRHVEVQLLGDSYGTVVHLGERECSIQRRHQKLIEESPCVALKPAVREKLLTTAVQGAQAMNYSSAGTMEFLVQGDEFYFMEMNTRIQVEHPVTEMVTGRDLIKEMIAVAAGQPLSFAQKDVRFNGHSIECRINAEDPERDFAPSPGKVGFVHMPGGMGVRVDSHVYQGYTISPYYDSMIAKVICHGLDRDEAVRRMIRALEECVVDGVHSTIDFQRAILMEPSFQRAELSTRFLEGYQWDGKTLTLGGALAAKS